MASGEDDFWNKSLLGNTNFFDDDLDVSSSLETDSLQLLPEQSNTLPIHSIISNKCLNFILDDINSTTIKDVVIPPEETIKQMFLGENKLLHVYKNFNDKLLLLDTAINIGDGNIILSVIIYLKKSLKKRLFLNNIIKRKAAFQHYADYLLERKEYTEFAELHMTTGNLKRLKDIYYDLIKENNLLPIALHKLEQFHMTYSPLFNPNDLAELNKHLAYLQWKMENKGECASIIDQLRELCQSEWTSGCTDEKIDNFKSKFKIDDFQFDWVVLNVLCEMGDFPRLTQKFIKPGWVRKKPALKSAIRYELIMNALGKYDVPYTTKELFLTCSNDQDQKLHFAHKLKIHGFIIRHYIEQKDRQSLVLYFDKLESKSPYQQMIKEALETTPSTKWKN